MTASEFKPTTSRLVAQCLNQLRHLLFYPDEDRRCFRNVAKFLPDYTASHPARWHSHHAHPRDNLTSRAPYYRSSYFPDLTSEAGDQTPTVGGFPPADIQCCWAWTFSGLNPDQDIVHIHVVSCVVPYRIHHSWWPTAWTLWRLKGNDLSAVWTFPDDADIRTSQPLCGWHGCVGEVSLVQEMCWQERPVVVRAVVAG